jgi:hypothetical protein
MTTTQTTEFYIGRNIGKDEIGNFITFSDKDLKSSHNKDYTKAHFKTYNEALKHMTHLIDSGSTWFDAHFDPSI